MKKCLLLLAAIMAFTTLQAQWTDNTDDNTFIANASTDAGEIYLSTDLNSGNTFVQWMCFGSNGWSPTLQCVDFTGRPLWGPDGIHIGVYEFSSSSDGVAMTSTTDNAAVSCFADATGKCAAVKINADGTFAWGTGGVLLFDGFSGFRTEVMAGDDGGVWALAADYNYSCLQYVNADGTLNPTIVIDDPSQSCVLGLMVPANNNGVFVVYEKEIWAFSYYYYKELYVAGYLPDGTQFSEETKLMDQVAIPGTNQHYVVPDGLGGAYVYIYHPAVSNAFNTYVFHFDATGASTIDDLNGIPVHTPDPAYFYLYAYATVDPITHDLIIAYEETDAATQNLNNLCANRITTTGDVLWGEDGKLLYEGGSHSCTDILVDSFEDGSGFSLLFNQTQALNSYYSTVEALGFDVKGDPLWTTTMSTIPTFRTTCENTTGFHGGQNIVIWTNTSDGKLYGQNIQPNGSLGPLPQGCPGPENFQASYTYDMETSSFGVLLNWDRPEEAVDYYVLYRTEQSTGEVIETEINGDAITYYDDSGIGTFKYQLKAMYAYLDCGLSLPATTPDGDDTVFVEVTNTEEYSCNAISKILKIYTMNGQVINASNVQQLKSGIYIIQGLTHDGKLISQKTLVRQE